MVPAKTQNRPQEALVLPDAVPVATMVERPPCAALESRRWCDARIRRNRVADAQVVKRVPAMRARGLDGRAGAIVGSGVLGRFRPLREARRSPRAFGVGFMATLLAATERTSAGVAAAGKAAARLRGRRRGHCCCHCRSARRLRGRGQGRKSRMPAHKTYGGQCMHRNPKSLRRRRATRAAAEA